jgi:hypothetical protein
MTMQPELTPAILDAMSASYRERIAAGETVDDLGRNIWVVRAGILCKRAGLADDNQAREFGREALTLLTARAAQGDDEAAAMAAALVGHVPELEEA